MKKFGWRKVIYNSVSPIDLFTPQIHQRREGNNSSETLHFFFFFFFFISNRCALSQIKNIIFTNTLKTKSNLYFQNWQNKEYLNNNFSLYYIIYVICSTCKIVIFSLFMGRFSPSFHCYRYKLNLLHNITRNVITQMVQYMILNLPRIEE